MTFFRNDKDCRSGRNPEKEKISASPKKISFSGKAETGYF